MCACLTVGSCICKMLPLQQKHSNAQISYTRLHTMGKYLTYEPDNDASANETTGESAGATGSADL